MLWCILSLQELKRKIYHWWMGLSFKEVHIKCKNRGSLNAMIQQGCCYWCQQLFSFSWYNQRSLIGAQLSQIKSFRSKGKGHIFLLYIFLGFHGFVFWGDGCALFCCLFGFFWWRWIFGYKYYKSLCPCLYGLSRKNAYWGLGRLLKASANAWSGSSVL